MIKKFLKGKNTNIILFIIITAIVSLATGLSNTVFSNYFKDAYDVTAYQRGLLEFPRELPGLLCLLVIGFGSFLGDIRLAIIAQVFSFLGIMALGLLTPTFTIMSIYLFVNSMGMHMYMPLKDSIGISLVNDKSKVGKRLGQYGGVRTAFRMVAGLIVFFGFRFGFFSFTSQIKWVFVISGLFSLIGLFLFVLLNKRVGAKVQSHKKIKLVFDKDYKFYYILAVLFGAQKQIIIVFGPWVLIDLLSKGADTISVLNMIGGFICMLFIPAVGRWIDKYGVKKMLYLDAVSFIIVYVAYGVISGMFSTGYLPMIGIPVIIAYGLYILDMMSESMDLIRVSYLRNIAKSDADITHTLSTGISMDHVVSIICAYLGGIVWTKFGPQYVFYIAAALSLINLYVATQVKENPVN
jgi:hypothetical protein